MLAVTLLGAGRTFLSCTEELPLSEDSKTSEAALDLSEIRSSDDPMPVTSLFAEILCFPCLGCKFQCNILKAASLPRSHYKAFAQDDFVKKPRQQSMKQPLNPVKPLVFRLT